MRLRHRKLNTGASGNCLFDRESEKEQQICLFINFIVLDLVFKIIKC